MTNFTEKQAAAIDIERLGQNACIVAGPGSGKTTVLVERYRRLIESGMSAREILAITFTEKAATNMKARICAKFDGDPIRRREIEGGYISTVHGFCQRMLKENAIAAGVDPQFAILDERQGQIRRARCAVDTLDSYLRECPMEAGRLMSALEQPDLAGALVTVHDAIRSAGVALDSLHNIQAPDAGELLTGIFTVLKEYLRFPGNLTAKQLEYRDKLAEWMKVARETYAARQWQPLAIATAQAKFQRGSVPMPWREAFDDLKAQAAELLGAVVAELYAPERRTLIDLLLRFDRLYATEKQKLGALDFSDLEYFAIRLLEEPNGVRERIQSQFRQILMDEYQDTNGQQARLLELLRARGNFYAVGDINQSIFGFRYASPGVFRAHRDRVQAACEHHVELFENFRSRPDILYAVEAVLGQAIGVERHVLEARRALPPKHLPSVEVTAALALESQDAKRIEAEWIASRILELRQTLRLGDESRPVEFRDFAVLVRKTAIIEALTEAFDRFGVQYQVTRQIGFFESREIRDLTHLLRTISNPRDEVSLAVVLRSQLAGISDEALFRLKEMSQKNPVKNLGSALEELDPAAGNAYDPLDWERLQRFRANLARWRAASQYLGVDRLLAGAMADCGYFWNPGTAASTNIEKLLALARNAPREQSLAEFVHEIQLIRDEDAREADAPFDEGLDAVRVITAHASKGLEFPIVFVPGIQSSTGNNSETLSFMIEGGLGTKWRNPTGGEPWQDWFRLRNKEAIKRREEQESNRLFYVAMTRAEEHLVLSYALGEKDRPSEWLKAVTQVFDMDSVALDGEPQVIEAGPPGRSFSAAVRKISNHPGAVEVDAAGTLVGRNIAVLPRPATTGQHEANITVTALTTFADCPRKYYLGRYLGWEPARGQARIVEHGDAEELEDDAGTRLSASELGRQVHALLAGQEVATPDLEALALADTFDKSPLGQRARKSRRIEHEFDFMLGIGDMVVRGQIDLWFEERGRHIIVDYKTDDIESSEAETRAQVYGLQLRLYALAVEKLTGLLPAEAWLTFLRLPDLAIPVSLGAEELGSVRALIADVETAQESLQFPLKEGAHCLRCPFYRGKCPAGTGRAAETETLAIG